MTKSLSVTSLGTVLSVWAHPDDETYLAGGLMAAARDYGQRVVCVTATAGERGSPDPVAWPPDRLEQVRRWEAAAAMGVLGVAEHHVVGMPDGRLSELDGPGRLFIERIISLADPDTIVTFGPDGATFHPDHIAVHRWVTAAWERGGRRRRLLYATATVDHLARSRDLYEEWGVFMSADRPAGTPAENVALRLSLEGAELDRKLTALRAMATQTAAVLERIDPERYSMAVAEEAFVDARAADRVVQPA